MIEKSQGMPRYSDHDMIPAERAFAEPTDNNAARVHHPAECDEAYVAAATDSESSLFHRPSIAEEGMSIYRRSDDPHRAALGEQMGMTQAEYPLDRQEVASTKETDIAKLDALIQAREQAHPAAKAGKNWIRSWPLPLKIGAVVSTGAICIALFGHKINEDDSSRASQANRARHEAAANDAVHTVDGLRYLHLCADELDAQAAINEYKSSHIKGLEDDRTPVLSADALTDAAAIARDYEVACLTPPGDISTFRLVVNGVAVVLKPEDITPDVDADTVCSDLRYQTASSPSDMANNAQWGLRSLIIGRLTDLAEVVGKQCS